MLFLFIIVYTKTGYDDKTSKSNQQEVIFEIISTCQWWTNDKF